MNKAQIFTSETCPYCIKAKKLLKMLNIDYDEFNADSNFEQMCSELSEKYNKPGISTVPQIILNGKYIGGYDDLESLYKNKKLDEFLK